MSSTQAPQRLVPSLQSQVCWSGEDQTVLVCTAVTDVTHDVKNFVFEPEGEQVFDFDPGQFLTLMLDIDGYPVNRCYTISSPPTRPHRSPSRSSESWVAPCPTGCTTTSCPAARSTRWLRSVPSRSPRQPAEKYLFLSAGSGDHPAHVDDPDDLRPRVGR